jgi:hypothetical protein
MSSQIMRPLNTPLSTLLIPALVLGLCTTSVPVELPKFTEFQPPVAERWQEQREPARIHTIRVTCHALVFLNGDVSTFVYSAPSGVVTTVKKSLATAHGRMVTYQ